MAGSDIPPILIADDDRGCIELVKVYLDKIRLLNPIEAAHDGAQAVDTLERLVQEGRPPCLCLLDLNMPNATGLDVLRWISEGPLAGTPTVILTGSADTGAVEQAFDLGARSYLVKPVGFRALADVIQNLNAPWVFTGGDPDDP